MSGAAKSDVSFRRTWDKDEYAEKAKKRDAEEADRMKENEERLKQGKRPRKGPKQDGPRPTELMQAHEDLELNKNLNKTIVVTNPGGRGAGQPGFYCETCNRNYRDTTGYLDHINSRAHLRAIGQTTKIERSTVEQVRARIALLRERTKEASQAKEFDFDQRLAEIKSRESAVRAERKAQKKAAKDKARQELVKETTAEDVEMAEMMGFGGFGSSKK
ncbi:hypothetical protein DL96DRAFT_1463260 [Flagelloscypha sp. PMI_526]|nr:hypothetical protein DL96DRAFT_1463260 [Flagelloscypha sp. PMI_526]